MNTKRIEAYSLFDFVKGVQEAVQEGYLVSDTNENFPQQFGTFYTCGVHKSIKDEEPVQESLGKASNQASNQAYKTISDEGSTRGTPDTENASKAVPEPSKTKGKAKG